MATLASAAAETSPHPPWSMAVVNAWDPATFVERMGGVFEGSPWIAERVSASRPFEDVESLHRAMVAIVHNATEDEHLALIRAHPDLVGAAALAGTLTRASTGEQAAAGLDPGSLTPSEIEEFAERNAAYKERFGFPFVICARENRKASILAGLRTRIGHSTDQERQTALDEIARIAWYRLADLLGTSDTVVSDGENGGRVSDIHHEISYSKLAVPVYRVYSAPLRGVAPIPESPFTGRDNIMVAREIDIQVLGENFLPAYTLGDNSAVVATDSMKNVIIREALNYSGATLEGFLHHLGAVFLATYPEMRRVRLGGRELPFAPERVPDGEGGFVDSDVLFGRSDGDFSTAMLEMDIKGSTAHIHDHRSGRERMRLLKVTGSAFTSFVRDGNTTLPERRDRPLFIYLDVQWRYRDLSDALGDNHSAYVPGEQVRDVVTAVFHEFVSESIQHLVHTMGTRILERFPGLSEVSFVAQNRTRDPFHRSESDPRVAVYSDPFPAYGEITLRMTRDQG